MTGPSLAEVESPDSFPGVLDEVAKAYVPVDLGEADALMAARENLYKSKGLEAALDLWRYSGRLEVELSWWRSQYPSTRMLVVALYYSKYTDRDISFVPRFREAAARFEPKERDARVAEIEYVEKNLESIRKRITVLLARTRT